MALLRNSDVLYYHPLDNTTEYTKDHVWDDTQVNMTFSGSIVVSGLTRAADSNVTQLEEALAGGGYTDISGATRFTACVWLSNFYSVSATTKTVIIGCEDSSVRNTLKLEKNSIDTLEFSARLRNTTFGDKVLSSKPSGTGWHFAVMDIEREDTDWRFRISFNGEDWQDLGTDTFDFAPDSNVRNTITLLDNGVAGNRVIADEVVVWKDAEIFTSTELSNLYELANTYSSPMNQYTETFPSEISVSGSADLFVGGYSVVSASRSLFIEGATTPVEPMRIIHHLVKTGDYNPQLLGSLTGTPTSVNIEVWDIVNAQNTLVAVTASGCYAIGNTGKWGWSTANLPFTSQQKKYHYYYRMTSNESVTADGEFFITVPERGRWSHPN